MDQEIYRHVPQGYCQVLQNGSHYNEPRLKTTQNIELHFRKSLCSLTHSWHNSYHTFKQFVIWIGFMALHINRGLRMVGDQGMVVAAVILYINNHFVFANEGLSGQINTQVIKMFQIHDLGSVSFYFSMTIKHNQEHHMIDINQHSYIQMNLVKFSMDESSPVATPIVMKLHQQTPDEEFCNQTLYQSMTIMLKLMMTAAEPNIAYTIGVLSQFNHDPFSGHIVAVNHVFWYLNCINIS